MYIKVRSTVIRNNQIQEIETQALAPHQNSRLYIRYRYPDQLLQAIPVLYLRSYQGCPLSEPLQGAPTASFFHLRQPWLVSLPETPN